jgi:hypothetical protein
MFGGRTWWWTYSFFPDSFFVTTSYAFIAAAVPANTRRASLTARTLYGSPPALRTGLPLADVCSSTGPSTILSTVATLGAARLRTLDRERTYLCSVAYSFAEIVYRNAFRRTGSTAPPLAATEPRGRGDEEGGPDVEGPRGRLEAAPEAISCGITRRRDEWSGCCCCCCYQVQCAAMTSPPALHQVGSVGEQLAGTKKRC